MSRALDSLLEPRSYVAVNLLEALKLVPDTGDWFGQLKQWCKLNLPDDKRAQVNPNRSYDEQKGIQRWRLFSDKEIDQVEESLAKTHSDKMHTHGMLAEITLERDRRATADRIGVPREELQ